MSQSGKPKRFEALCGAIVTLFPESSGRARWVCDCGAGESAQITARAREQANSHAGRCRVLPPT